MKSCREMGWRNADVRRSDLTRVLSILPALITHLVATYSSIEASIQGPEIPRIIEHLLQIAMLTDYAPIN